MNYALFTVRAMLPINRMTMAKSGVGTVYNSGVIEQRKDHRQRMHPGEILHLQSCHDAAPNRRNDVPQATVLIVDDEEAVRETLSEALSFHGYRVLTAANVQEAEAIKERIGVD